MIDEQTRKNIITELGLKESPKEKAEEIMAKLEENIQRKVVLEVLDLLKKEDQKKLTEIIESENDKDVLSFIYEKIPASTMNFLIKAVAESAVKEFKNSIK